MKYSDFKNHRNNGYMAWLRTKNCVVTGSKAQCAHHIRLGTNGGSSLKPSDYFCIPLENEYHTHGPLAVHKIGEDTFLKKFKLNKEELFIGYLSEYLKESYQIVIELKGLEPVKALAILIEEIERRRPAKKVSKTKKTVKPKNDQEKIKAPKPSETEFYQKAKELKRVRDKELRDSLKAQKPKVKVKVSSPKSKTSVKDDPFYQKAKELKREQDKALRKAMKEEQKSKSQPVGDIDYYAKIKEEQKLKAREYRKAQYRKLKQLKSEQK